MDRFIHIRSTKFPILPGETEELVNQGTYSKALAMHLREKLIERGYVRKACANLEEFLKADLDE